MSIASTRVPNLPDKEEFETIVSASFCSRCESVIFGDLLRHKLSQGPSHPSVAHHYDVSSFHAAITTGCYICIRIRDKLSQSTHEIIPSSNPVPLTTCTISGKNSDMVEIQIRLETHLRNFIFLNFGLFASKAYMSPTCLPQFTYSSKNSRLASWLGKCTAGDQNHVKCHELRALAFTPYRILELGSDQSWRVSVPLDDNIQVTSYTTLSYCWGNGSFLKLTSQTYSKFRSWMPISDLPQVFQDAITVTRDLQIRFIWIDALCIVQDSKEDFRRQCSGMSLIYTNTSCNIAAAISEHPNTSMFGQRNLEASRIGRFEDQRESARSDADLWGSLDSIFNMDYFDDLRNVPFFSRGWILQELILSPCTLYFCKNQVHWLCRYFEACDIWPQGNPSLIHGLVEPSAFFFKNRSSSGQSHSWNKIVEKYTRLTLSHAEDRLVALSGLVQAFQLWTSDEYMAGHWKNQLRVSLNWTPRPYFRKPTRSTVFIAPSWSWASINGDIYSELPTDQTSILCDVVSVIVEPAGEDATGQLLSGQLILVAPSKRVPVSGQEAIYLSELQRSEHTSCSAFWSSEVQFPSEAYVELALTYVHFRRVAHITFLPHAEPWDWEMEIKSLILIQPDPESEIYERVGTFSITSRFGPGHAPTRYGLQTFGLEINDDTRQVIATHKSCYREFKIV